MSTVLRTFTGIALMALGFFMARVGCQVLAEGLYGRSIFSIVTGIVGVVMIAGGIYPFIKGWQQVSEPRRSRPVASSDEASSYPQTSPS